MNQSEALAEVRAGRIRPVYLIYGGEPFLEGELYRAIRAALVQPETADFNFHLVDPAADQVARAVGLAQTQPFFAERRLVVLRDCPVFAPSRKAAVDEEEQGEEKPAAGDDGLLAYLKNPVPSTCLVIMNERGVDTRKRAAKAVIAAGAGVECRPYKEPDCQMWAQSRAQFYGKHLGDSAARLLVVKLGTNLSLHDSELQKLSLYVGTTREITARDVDAAVGGVAETEVYRLTEAVMLGQRQQALSLLERLIRQVDHPLQLLAALSGRYRQMLLIKALVARRMGPKEGAGLARMHPFAYDKMAGYLRTIPRDAIVGGLEKLLEADVAMKSGFDPKVTLETTVVELLDR